MQNEFLKEQVQHYWNKQSCGTEVTNKHKFSKNYFDEIENFRYSIEPEIFSFAQFSRYSNKKVLEVGVGAGTDFIQWIRSGAKGYGIDLTPEAIENTKIRLELENLKAAELKISDAENLPYPNDFFDLVYSWGVIHHSPDTEKCLGEIARVAKSGGRIKIMIYNRRSLFAFYRWLIEGFFRARPFQSISKVLWNNQESPGTKAYTKKEAIKMISKFPLKIISIKSTVSAHDLLYYKSRKHRIIANIAASILGWNKCGWFMTIELEKI
jgi:ubiquinone/menaquinone biosynthesis C-methylase UbiE